MVELDFYSKGIHIFAKNGQRYINYGERDINAGKYYYLNVLESLRSNSFISNILSNSICNLYQAATGVYDVEIFKKGTNIELCKIKDPCIRTQTAAFLLIIYLAMIDLEESHKYQIGFGKRMVHESCMAVINGTLDYQAAAVMFQRTSSSNVSDNNYDTSNSNYNEWDDYGTSGEKYGWYNDYSDDVIDDAFDGHPEATWNID